MISRIQLKDMIILRRRMSITDLYQTQAGGILRIAQDGSSIQGVIGNKPPLSEYYAYGIRNSFGMEF